MLYDIITTMVLLFVNGNNNRWACTLRDTATGKMLTEYGTSDKGYDIATLHKLAIHVGTSLLKRPVPLKIIGAIPNPEIINYTVNTTAPEMQMLSYLCM